ncbi:phage holin family protein, partial [Tepidimonas charontis]|uniref:phage holin family protein n=1 Tax=Tepidimonas charontis TaxID=2267262 RepID=UPI001F2F1123
HLEPLDLPLAHLDALVHPALRFQTNKRTFLLCRKRTLLSCFYSFANLFELIGELATSAFAGLITFWLCEAAQFKPLITAALVGISGHMGSRAIFQLERWAQARFGHRDHEGDGKNG